MPKRCCIYAFHFSLYKDQIAHSVFNLLLTQHPIIIECEHSFVSRPGMPPYIMYPNSFIHSATYTAAANVYFGQL